MKTCFISAPANIDLAKLRGLLKSKHIRAILPFEQPITGGDFQEQIMKGIRKADFCVGLLVDNEHQSNVFFELGVASALHKPLLLIQEKKSNLTTNIWGIPTAKYDPPDFVGLGFFLDQFLSKATPTSRKKPSGLRRTKPLAGIATQLAAHLESLGGHATHIEIERILESAFRNSGIRVSAEPKHGDRQYDFAIWVDELSELIGNPLLVEIKTKLSAGEAERIRDQFVSSSANALGRALVVVHANQDSSLDQKSRGTPLVLFVSVQSLLEKLRARSLGNFIRSERNRLVHGI